MTYFPSVHPPPTPVTNSLAPPLWCPFQSHFPGDGPIWVPESHVPLPGPSIAPSLDLQYCWGRCQACNGGPGVHKTFILSELPLGAAQILWLGLPWFGTLEVEASVISIWRLQAETHGSELERDSDERRKWKGEIRWKTQCIVWAREASVKGMSPSLPHHFLQYKFTKYML